MAEVYTWVISHANVTATTAASTGNPDPENERFAPHWIADA